ncbi:hypothetical protein [Bradyrhizobium cajani]|uniref:Uncharacterized protein n=1 Tax=Bradyrhizobium cajani TaxID=1928661 RepID=A0A844TFB2_9BRAD|nr:hypothetical protein [Bradyrhizobium cajani]MCP3370444.1 hypothetical protein [Bradyrhizobium cajani]MVT77733.1 hypothetical protein [Bradyrhizobium cajani]
MFFSKARTRTFRVIVTQKKFNSSMSLEKEPAGAFNKAQRLNEQVQRIPHLPHLQGLAGLTCPVGSAERIRVRRSKPEQRLTRG